MNWQWKPNQRVYITRRTHVGRHRRSSRDTILVIIGVVFTILAILAAIL